MKVGGYRHTQTRLQTTTGQAYSHASWSRDLAARQPWLKIDFMFLLASTVDGAAKLFVRFHPLVSSVNPGL
jgi:hypothetical protein